MKINGVDFDKSRAMRMTKREFIGVFEKIFYQELPEDLRRDELSKAWELLNDKVKKGAQPDVVNEGAE
jgi:hypothetical protein